MEAGANTRTSLGFCKAATLEQVGSHNYVLAPGRYVGAAHVEDDDVPFTQRFDALKVKLDRQFSESESDAHGPDASSAGRHGPAPSGATTTAPHARLGLRANHGDQLSCDTISAVYGPMPKLPLNGMLSLFPPAVASES